MNQKNLRISFLKWTDPRVELAWRSMETTSTSPYLHYDYLTYVARFTRRAKPLYRVRVACIFEREDLVMMVALKGSFNRTYWKMLGDIQGCGMADALWKPSLTQDERLQDP